MKIKRLDHTNKIIYLTCVTDDDSKLLEFIGYIHCESEDEGGEQIEMYKPISLIYSGKIGKWVAFTQEGMEQTLHGKVIRVNGSCMVIKCKNGETRYANINDCYKFFDNKKECYEFKQ